MTANTYFSLFVLLQVSLDGSSTNALLAGVASLAITAVGGLATYLFKTLGNHSKEIAEINTKHAEAWAPKTKPLMIGLMS